MSLFLMADADYAEFKKLEARSLEIEASKIEAASQKTDHLKMERDGDTASIHINGMLTPKRIGFLDFFGRPQTVWGDVVSNVQAAESEGIKKLRVFADSGGGIVDGMFETMDAFADSSMEIEGIVTGQAQSAMYMLLSQADTISSTREYNWIGNIGVKAKLDDGTYVSNTDSPNKVGSAKREDGSYAIQDSLDDLYAMILPRMARGRGKTIDEIKEKWGQGASMTAKTALSRGMIDMIEPMKKPAGRSGITKGHTKMDMATLKAEHPDLYSQVFNAGKEAGSADFKELAEAHISLAEASGAMDRAIEDIKAGTPVGPKVYAFHTAEGIKQSQIKARGDEAPPEVGEGDDAQAAAHDEKNDSEDVVKAFAEAGLEVEL
jgi:ATP-dependent protease ClpP protease subunit